MESYLLAISVATKALYGSLIAVPEMTIEETIDTRYYKVDDDRNVEIARYIEDGVNICKQKGIKPLAICISMKGNHCEKNVCQMDQKYLSKKREAPEKQSQPKENLVEFLKSSLKQHMSPVPPIYVMNRFQAYALGAYVLKGRKISSSYSCVNLSNGAGSGNIIHSQISEKYGKSGMGGLKEIPRRSDGRYMKIASIAGIKTVEERTKALGYKNIADCLTTEVQKKSYFIDDIADAIAELILNQVSRNTLYVDINVYTNEISPIIKNTFLERVRKLYKRKTDDFKYIDIFLSDKSEDQVKMIGVAQYVYGKMYSTSKQKSDNLFVITGFPGSGKSTLAGKLFCELKNGGAKVGSIISREKRRNGRRIGFDVEIDGSKECVELAILNDGRHYDHDRYRKFGNNYLVNYANVLNKIVPAIWKNVADNDIVIIDEVAGMQLFVPEFEATICNILSGKRNVIVTVPEISTKYAFINKLKSKAIASNHLYQITSWSTQDTALSSIKAELEKGKE